MRPDIVWTTGGYIGVSVSIAAFILRIPVWLHCSDAALSLSDRCIGRFAVRISSAFPVEHFPPWFRARTEESGQPIRRCIREGVAASGLRLTGFSGRRPILLVIGGSQGSLNINQAIDRCFDDLINVADIIHLTGKGKAIDRQHARYVALPFSDEQLPHFYTIATIVISRAGGSALAELAAVQKPSIIIPLEGVGEDHQVRNAESLASRGAVVLLRESALTTLPDVVRQLLQDSSLRERLSQSFSHAYRSQASEVIAQNIVDVLRSSSVE